MRGLSVFHQAAEAPPAAVPSEMEGTVAACARRWLDAVRGRAGVAEPNLPDRGGQHAGYGRGGAGPRRQSADQPQRSLVSRVPRLAREPAEGQQPQPLTFRLLPVLRFVRGGLRCLPIKNDWETADVVAIRQTGPALSP